MPDRRTDVEDFLYVEAACLDNRRFRDWLALFAEDCWYWLPVSPDQTERSEGLAHINDDRALLEIRVDRLSGTDVIPQQPPSATSRMVGNVQIAAQTGDRIDVRSRLHMIEYRPRPYEPDEYRSFAAAVTHILHSTDDGFRIAGKRVDLVNATAALDAISVPL